MESAAQPEWIDDRSGVQEKLVALLQLSHSMLAAAEEQRWDLVAEIEDRRRGVISELFGSPTSHSDATNLAACLRQVLAFDRRMLDQGDADLRAIAEKLTDMHKGRSAQAAYLSSPSEP